MLIHYIKVALRNLWKYKTQSIISIIGLSVGFVCFALSALWIRHEMTYDVFHQNAKNIYILTEPSIFNSSGREKSCAFPLAAYLKNTFPEIKQAAHAHESIEERFEIDGKIESVSTLCVDSSFLSLMNIRIIEGSLDFLDQKNIAITVSEAKRLFGDEYPIGKKLKEGDTEYEITAVITAFKGHSNYPYEILRPMHIHYQDIWNATSGEVTLIELYPEINENVFLEKLKIHEISSEVAESYGPKDLDIIPLTKLHYTDPTVSSDVHFQHIVLFAFAGLLVIVMSLFNYITLFVSRFRIRNQEFALRLVTGANWISLFFLLLTELLLTLLLATSFGLIIARLVMNIFMRMTEINMNLSTIYLELLFYIVVIICIAVLVFLFVLLIFRKRNLNLSIRKKNSTLFRKLSLIVQTTISIGFIFCTCILFKQINHLRQVDLGFSYRNTVAVQIHGNQSDVKALEGLFNQIPEVTQTLAGFDPLLPILSQASYGFDHQDEGSSESRSLKVKNISISAEYAEFYEFQLIEGEMLQAEATRNDVLINESTKKLLNWTEAVGKTFGQGWTVRGVIKDIYRFTPTIPADATIYSPPFPGDYNHSILMRYQKGRWKEVKKKIEEIIQKEFPDMERSQISNGEEEYEKYLSSENALIKLLGFISLICIIISVFGFFSLISLTCEERRKEIAIRKVNGAEMKNIVNLFFKEYLLLLLIAALIAFPVVYKVMKTWIEQYVHQTSINWWIYLSILSGLILIITICVGSRIYKTAKENPADELKMN